MYVVFTFFHFSLDKFWRLMLFRMAPNTKIFEVRDLIEAILAHALGAFVVNMPILDRNHALLTAMTRKALQLTDYPRWRPNKLLRSLPTHPELFPYFLIGKATQPQAQGDSFDFAQAGFQCGFAFHMPHIL